MNTEQAYINGFLKKAISFGLPEKQALELAAAAPGMARNSVDPMQQISLALNPAQQQVNVGGNFTNPVNFKMEDLAQDFQAKGRLNDLSKEIIGRTPYPASGQAGNYLMNANKINQLGQNMFKQSASSPAWQRSAGKNPEGGLNAKGRASYKSETGGTLKAPVTESNPKGERAKRQNSFCSRMCGMKRVNTGSKAQSDPDSRINKSLRKWNCKCGSEHSTIQEKIACTIKEASRCWEGYEPVPGKKPYSNDSCRKKTPKKPPMKTKQAYINGFLKRAHEYGLTEAQALEVLKKAEAPLPVAYGQTPVNNAVRDAVMAPINWAGGMVGKGVDAVKNYMQHFDETHPSVSRPQANQVFNKTLNRPAVKPQ